MVVKILTLESSEHVTAAFGVEVDGIRNAWAFKDDLHAAAKAFEKCAEWLRHVSTLSEDEKAKLRARSAA